MADAEIKAVEAAIDRCVREFYGKARQDPLLGPVFDAEIADWEVHFRVVGNFWSGVLLKTDRYSGHPYPPHVNLPIEPQHIDRWLELFTETAHATLRPPYVERALARARMMGDSFKAGLFPFLDKNGKPSRHPA